MISKNRGFLKKFTIKLKIHTDRNSKDSDQIEIKTKT